MSGPGTHTAPPRSAEGAYEAMAPVYDAFTAHYDYELWLGNFLPKLRPYQSQGRRLLDVGCGTGKSFLPMLKRGWEVTACDISPSMLALAEAKAGGAASLRVADMRELPTFGSFDLVWAIDDAVNYMLSVEELEAALTGMRRNLAPGGLVMFDLNTLASYRTFFAHTEVRESRGWRLTWRGQASPTTKPGSISEAILEAESVSRNGEHAPDAAVEPHRHRQRHFPEGQVLACLKRSGLECLEVFGHGFDAVPHQPLRELTHEKAVYIAATPGEEELRLKLETVETAVPLSLIHKNGRTT
jgi:SAM-dependent methyltransferase